MSSKLMREFEEFEGPDTSFDASFIIDPKDEDDSNFTPANAAVLTTADIFYEVYLFIILFILKILYVITLWLLARETRLEKHRISRH